MIKRGSKCKSFWLWDQDTVGKMPCWLPFTTPKEITPKVLHFLWVSQSAFAPCLWQMTLIIFFFFPPLGSLRISEVNFLDSPHLLRVLVKLLEPYALLCSIGMVFKIKLSTLIILPPFPGFSCPRLMNFVQLFFHALVISAFVLAPSLFLKRSSVHLSSVSSVTQSCPTLCHPMDCGRPGFPIHYQCLELAQTHVHWVNDTIQPSHPLSSPSPLAFDLSQHHSLFQ